MNGFLILLGVSGFGWFVFWANSDSHDNNALPLKSRVLSAIWNCPLWATPAIAHPHPVSSGYAFGYKEARAAISSGTLPKDPSDEQIARYLSSRFSTKGDSTQVDPEMIVSSLNPEDIYYPLDGIDMGSSPLSDN